MIDKVAKLGTGVQTETINSIYIEEAWDTDSAIIEMEAASQTSTVTNLTFFRCDISKIMIRTLQDAL